MTYRSKRLALSAVSLLLCLGAPLPPMPAGAETLTDSARSAVQNKLLDPLQKKEAHRPRFSRAVIPPGARRLRILDGAGRTDSRGRVFVSFAVDESRSFGIVKPDAAPEDQWFENAITGCVYPASGEVIVKLGEVYYPSSVLLGRSAQPSPSEDCR